MSFDFPDTPNIGDILTGANGANYRWDGTKWVTASPPPSTVTSFNSRQGDVLLTQGDVALGLGYTPYNAANPSHYIPDAPSDTNAYVRLAAAWVSGDTRYLQQSAADARYVPLAGGVPMTGPLTLFGSPSGVNDAATKAYADARPYVATTTGAVSVTGVTTETNLAALRIPANTLGANGAAELKTLWTHTGNANNKSLLVRFTGVAGSTSGGVTSGTTVVASSFQSTHMILYLRNAGATNSQYYPNTTGLAPFGSSLNPPIQSSVDTTLDTYININGTLAVGTDTLTLVHAYLVVFPHV
jgi:hypothetical protein